MAVITMKHFASDYEIDEAVARYEGLPYLAKSCNCWDGYERVPGTKPCAPGSCRKCDDHAKKESAFKTSGLMQIVQEIVNLYSSQPQFAMAVQRALFSVAKTLGRAWSEGSEGVDISTMYSSIKNYIDSLYQYWKAGQIELDDIDQAILGANLFGEKNPNLLGAQSKVASQGDKPSPNAAKAVLEALVAGDEDAALDLLGETDCPEGCDTHPEGKCNHQYMAAGRTRIRYLIDNQAFKKSDEKPKEFGTTHYDSPDERS